MTHHSVTPTADGGYWVPAQRSIDEAEERFLPSDYSLEELRDIMKEDGNYFENSVIKISAEGVVEKEFSVLKAVHEAGLEANLYDANMREAWNPIHLNEIEVVTPALAAKIDAAAPGDLLLSVRNMHMLAILDADDGSLKWHKSGPWVRQHDPDIMPDGRIEIFNNRSKSVSSAVTGSQIVSFDPANDDVRILAPIGVEDSFFTTIMGTHQRLNNNNLLVTESVYGRVMEVNAEGEIVWEYVQPFNEAFASLFPAAARYDRSYFEVEDWSCGQ